MALARANGSAPWSGEDLTSTTKSSTQPPYFHPPPAGQLDKNHDGGSLMGYRAPPIASKSLLQGIGSKIVSDGSSTGR